MCNGRCLAHHSLCLSVWIGFGGGNTLRLFSYLDASDSRYSALNGLVGFTNDVKCRGHITSFFFPVLLSPDCRFIGLVVHDLWENTVFHLHFLTSSF